MANKLSKELHDKLKDIYPESRSLSMDRRFNAETILDPTDPKQLKEWALDKDKKDARGFDDKSGREPSVKKVVDSVSGESRNYVEEDIDRFVDTSQETGKLIDKVSDKIFDYNSMKKAIKESWGNDLKGLSELADRLTNRDYNALFNSPLIQRYIQNNTQSHLVNYIQKRFKVEPVRASRIINKLGRLNRAKLFYVVRHKRLPKIKMPTKSGRRTRRRFSQQETNFIYTNKHLTDKTMTKLFNQTFQNKRDISSIRNKLHRIRKQNEE